jgi:hypothetical protein
MDHFDDQYALPLSDDSSPQVALDSFFSSSVISSNEFSG